ncbi:dipeptidase 1 (renal) [Chytriomyces hyalinus]|nr:dipeptidase 1 (renal) [Chytriomyces hyalinus]
MKSVKGLSNNRRQGNAAPLRSKHRTFSPRDDAQEYRARFILKFIFYLGLAATAAFYIAREWGNNRGIYAQLWSLHTHYALLTRVNPANEKMLFSVETSLDRAYRLLKFAPIIDTHNDLPFKVELLTGGGNLSAMDLYNLPKEWYQTDIVRLKQGRVGALFYSAYVDCYNYTWQTDNLKKTLEQIDLVKRIIAKYPHEFEFATSTTDIKRITSTGKIASLIGLEGGHQIDASMGTLRMMYDLGVRYMTLTHSCATAWADSSNPPFVHDGLGPDGAKFIYEMNRLGIMVDLSHVSHKVMDQTIRTSAAPVIFSHSSVFAVTNHTRNVPDDILQLVKEKDGVVMINFYKEYVRGVDDVGDAVGMGRVVEHMLHVKNLIGARHLGMGADYDGDIVPVDGLEDVSKYPILIASLLEHGFTDDEIVGVTGGNLLRVFEKVEKVAHEMQQAHKPIEEMGVDVAKRCPDTQPERRAGLTNKGC